MARILIVDDDEILSDMVTELLARSEHMVSAVHHGDEAMAAVLDSAPDLLILDHALPGRSGLEVLRELRGLPQMDSVPVMMMTGSSDASLLVRAALSGADEYVTKPFAPADLVRRTEAMLRGRALSRQVTR